MAKTSNGSVSVSNDFFPKDTYTVANETVTVTVTSDAGYKLKSLKYNDGTDHDITDAKSFTMPLANVTVTAEFVKAYPIWIGYSDQYNPGVQVTAGDVLGDGTVIYTPDAEHPDTKGTLTLNGAKLFTGDSDVAPSGIMVGDGYLPFTELTIELVGENQIGKAPEAPNESSAYKGGSN